MGQKAKNGAVFGEGDVVILVTGLIRSGKSTFINTLLGWKYFPVSDRLSEVTQKVDYVVIGHDQVPDHVKKACDIDLERRRLVIVDTPGLHERAAKEKIFEILTWLQDNGVKAIAGVLYLYDITPERHVPAFSKLDVAILRASFQDLAEEAFERFIFVTTKWNNLVQSGLHEISRGENRERELKAEFWKDMIERGSTVKRFYSDDPRSAWDIISALLQRPPHPLQGFDIGPQLKTLRKHLKKGDTSFLSTVLELLRGIFSG